MARREGEGEGGGEGGEEREGRGMKGFLTCGVLISLVDLFSQPLVYVSPARFTITTIRHKHLGMRIQLEGENNQHNSGGQNYTPLLLFTRSSTSTTTSTRPLQLTPSSPIYGAVGAG